MKYIKDQENLKDKKILLRLDLNVPLKNRIITIKQSREDPEKVTVICFYFQSFAFVF